MMLLVGLQKKGVWGVLAACLGGCGGGVPGARALGRFAAAAAATTSASDGGGNRVTEIAARLSLQGRVPYTRAKYAAGDDSWDDTA